MLVLATNVKGELRTAPLEGVTTVMADADIADAANAKNAKKGVFMVIPQIRMASTRDGTSILGLQHIAESASEKDEFGVDAK